MRYLNKRNEFIKKVNEEITSGTGGPFHNDLGWNDSLLGRLINHTIRKSKIQLKVKDVKGLVSKLEQAFDGIILENKLNEISDDSKSKVKEITTFMFFKNLISGVDKGKEVPELIELTNEAIDNSKSLKNETVDAELEKFKNFLEQNANAGVDSGSGPSDDNANSVYSMMFKNLKSLSQILQNYNKTISTASELHYKIKSGDTLKGIQMNSNINRKKLSIQQIKDKNSKFIDFKDDQLLPANVELLLESTFGATKSADSGLVSGSEDHSTQALKKLKKDISILISSKEKGIAVDDKLVSSFLSNSNNTESKELLKKLYAEILRYLVGDKKGTIQEKDDLFVESIDVLSDDNKLSIIAEKIARFSKRALQFDGQNLYGGLGELGDSLKTFVDSLKYVISKKGVKEKTDNNTSEGFLKYDEFLSYITESKEDLSDSSLKIKEFFDENCKTVREYKIEGETTTEIENELKDAKPKEVNFQMDSVIEVVKLFNRAYKLYTVKTITKRSENVDTSTLGEYTSFGGNGETGRSGPYRNNKLFQVWEDGVYEILGNRKYQAIFTKNANLKLPKVTNPSFDNDEHWEIKANAGQNLRTFMSKMLDGDNIYRTGDGSGQIHTLIEKYFGSEASSETEKALKGDKDINENKEMADKIYENSTKLKFLKGDKKPVNRSVFMIDCLVNKEEEAKQRTFFINAIENGVVYLTVCVSSPRIQKYLYATKDTKFSVDKGDFPRALSVYGAKMIYTKIKLDDFNKYMKEGGSIKMTSCTSSGSNSFKTDDIVINDIYWLVNSKDNKVYYIPKEDKERLGVIIRDMNEKDFGFIKSQSETLKIIGA